MLVINEHERRLLSVDRLSSDAQTAAGSGAAIGTVAYGYDLGGRMTSMIPGGQGPGSYGYVYDPGNRLTSITPTPGKSVCITYDQADRRTALVYPSSLTANYSWDNLSDETQLAYTWKGSFTPGNPGTCTPGTTTNGATGNLTYGYDQDGRQWPAAAPTSPCCCPARSRPTPSPTMPTTSRRCGMA